MEALEFVSIVPWEIVMQLVNLLILVLLLRHFLFGPVQRVLAQRDEEIAQQYAEAARTSEQAERTRQEYEQRMVTANQEAESIVTRAQQRAHWKEAEILDEAQRQADRIVERGSEDVEQERRRAVRSLREEVSALAMELAERVVGRELTARDHERLIQECIDGLGDVR